MLLPFTFQTINRKQAIGIDGMTSKHILNLQFKYTETLEYYINYLFRNIEIHYNPGLNDDS